MGVICFGLKNNLGTCSVLDHPDPNCGTTKCPFFKPEGCKEYTRTEKDGKVIFKKGNEIYTGDYK